MCIYEALGHWTLFFITLRFQTNEFQNLKIVIQGNKLEIKIFLI